MAVEVETRMPSVVNFCAHKTDSEELATPRASLRRNPDKTPVPAMNPPLYKPNRFAPKAREAHEPRRIVSPAVSAVRGQVAPAAPEPTNAELMAFLLKNFPAAK
jgi:hypothetical protein